MSRPIVLSLLSIIISSGIAQGDSLAYTFTTLPSSGLISGQPSSEIGWGYSITNESNSDWLVTTGLNAGLFTGGTPNASLFDYPVLPPSITVTMDFNLSASAGLYGITWDSSATTGTVDTGQFILSAQWWTGDPNGSGIYIQDASKESANYSASVEMVPTPEPSSFIILATIAFALPGNLTKLRKYMQ